MPITASCGRQVRFSTSSAEIVGHRPRRSGERELGVDLLAQHARRRLGLLDALRRDLDMEVGQPDLARRLVLEARQQPAQ